ncbi:MAG: PilZ domain-containing protein [Reinekea sp.]|jgi:c-di-GMP-binding flagellar brake protein YcgR
MKNDQRASPRTPIKLTVSITFENGTTVNVETWDISDGGIGVLLPEQSDISWSVGDTVIAQVQGLPAESPKLPMEIVRIGDHGVGLKIINK